MTTALIIVTALAVLLLLALLRSGSSQKAAQTAAEQREKSLTGERDKAREEATKAKEAATEAAEATAEAEAALGELQAEHETLQARAAKLESQVDQSNNETHLLRAELQDAKTAAEAQIADLESRNVALVDDRNQLANEITDVTAKLEAKPARPDLVLNDAAANGTLDPTTLWNLEMARAERRWRHSVATNPESDPSPFIDIVDPVRMAVEVEASALREEVGAFITIDWQAGIIEDPARRILVLRVAQEILSAAAREPEASKLIVSGNEEVSLRLAAAEEGDDVANLLLPSLASDLITVNDDSGVEITVATTP